MFKCSRCSSEYKRVQYVPANRERRKLEGTRLSARTCTPQDGPSGFADGSEGATTC